MKPKKRVTRITRRCDSCGGTGLYVGMGERNGAAVVCRTCGGTGREVVVVEWVPFTKRVPARGVTRVYATNPGICAAPDVVPGGIPYAEWLRKGLTRRGAEMREHTCPAWWYQTADYRRKPEWEECRSVGAFRDCPRFKRKNRCWARFDAEGL